MTPEQLRRSSEAARRVYAITKSRESFLDYVRLMMPDPEDMDDVSRSRFDVAPHHRLLAEVLEKVERGEEKRVCISLAPRHGKLVAHETPVLTVDGWKTHGQLKVGDLVFHPSGRPVEVIAVSEDADASMEVKCTTGETIKVHPNHEWTVLPPGHKSFKTLETREIAVRKITRGVKGKRGFRWNHRLPAQYPLLFPAQYRNALEPYVLGAWLGDGSSSKPAITHAASDTASILAIESLGYRKSAVCEHQETKVLTTYFSGPKPNNSGRLWIELKELNLNNNKHIPSMYLTASIQDRLHLLAGLIDTDGYVNAKTSRVVFSNCNKRLIDDVVELVRGLGMYPELQEVEPVKSSSGIQGKQMVYRVVFQPTLDIPTRLPRKRIIRTVKRRSDAIESITPCAPVAGRCIQVDSPDGLYLVGKTLIPTHNSEMCSRMFPSWLLGKNPYRQVIIAGASGTFAVDEFGRKIKNIVKSPYYAQVFPKSSLDGGSESVENIVFQEGGNIKSIGKGAQIIGRGADVLIVDDPISSLEEARSELERDKLWDWFTTDCMTRLQKGGRVLIIHQRWHNDDLIGRLVDPDSRYYNPATAKEWLHVKLPAVIDSPNLAKALGLKLEKQTDPVIIEQFGEEPMAAIWEDHYSLKFFAELRRPNPARFEALYRGNPHMDQGNFFQKDWFKPYAAHELPKNLRIYMAGDFAVSTRQTADRTCIVPVGVDSTGTVWVLPDIFWKRSDTEGTVAAILNLIKKHKPLLFWAEKGHISQSFGPFLRKRMQQEKIFATIVEKTPVKDKMTRSQAFSALCSMGRVRFPFFAHWWRDAEAELLKFNGGDAGHDDFVDAMSWIGIGLDQQVSASVPYFDTNTEPKTGTLAWVKRATQWEERQKTRALADGY